MQIRWRNRLRFVKSLRQTNCLRLSQPEDEEPIQAPTPREPEDEEPEIVTPAITRRRLRAGGGASWWARLLRRLAEATY